MPLDTGFNLNAIETVNCTSVQADGKIVTTGAFATIGGVSRNHLARLNTDGILDSAFNPNVNNDIYSLALQTNGKVFIGGSFTSVGGVTRNHIARVDSTDARWTRVLIQTRMTTSTASTFRPMERSSSEATSPAFTACRAIVSRVSPTKPPRRV